MNIIYYLQSWQANPPHAVHIPTQVWPEIDPLRHANNTSQNLSAEDTLLCFLDRLLSALFFPLDTTHTPSRLSQSFSGQHTSCDN